MKKLFLIIVTALVLVAAMGAWLVFAPATAFETKSKFLFVRAGKDVSTQVLDQIKDDIDHSSVFSFVAAQTGVWQRLKAGRFEIKNGQSIFDIIRTLRNNAQSPVKLVVNKLRIKEDLAKLISKNFDIEFITAAEFLNSNDSLIQLGVDTNTIFTTIIPDTYLFNWNISLTAILKKMQAESEKFWSKNDRLQKATDMGLTPAQIYIIASIVEEETNKQEDKGKIASVYINRMNKGMALGADPTIKYALRDFGLKRVLYGHLKVGSPYNTYRNKGLPPGPVCTPSQKTIDAVLDAPRTDFLFFVATSDLSGYSHFSTNFAEHDQYAKLYQKALNDLMAKKQKQ